MFRPSIFKLSLAFIILGIVWISYTTIQSDKISENFILEIDQTEQFSIFLNGNDFGYYKVSLPESEDFVFVEIFEDIIYNTAP